MRIVTLAAALALTIASAPALAETATPAWHKVSGETGAIDDPDGLAGLAAEFPDSGSVRLRLLNAQLKAEQFDGLLETLAWLKERGYVFSDAARAQIPQLVGEEHAERAAALLLPPAAPIATSEVVAMVPEDAGLVESVCVPGEDGIFIATSVTGHALFFGNGEGEWVEVDVPNASDLSGIVSDPERNIGWVASANIDGSVEAGERFTGLIGIVGPDDGFLYVPAPEGAAVSDLHLAQDGTVYASDPLGGGVYRMRPGADLLETFVAPGTFRSPQGLATSADGRSLYISDYRYGIAMVDLASGAVSRLASDVPTILDGIDGLWRHGNALIAVQNGTSPIRISAFELSDDGTHVVFVRTLERGNPEWTEPLSGSIEGNALHYIGNGQWDRFEKGEPVPDKPALPTQIRRLPLD